jgi:hypothetical protein
LLNVHLQIRDMLANPAKFAPSRSLPPLSFNAFHWEGEVMASLGLDPMKLPLALVTSRDSDKVRTRGAALVSPGLQCSI